MIIFSKFKKYLLAITTGDLILQDLILPTGDFGGKLALPLLGEFEVETEYLQTHTALPSALKFLLKVFYFIVLRELCEWITKILLKGLVDKSSFKI